MIKKKWDMFAESVSMSLSNIAGNKMRTFLTTLGIIIGVGAIIALMTVVQGATDTMNAQFDAMGLGTLRVSVAGTAIKHGLTDDDLQTILDCEHVAGISPSLNATVTAKRGNVWSDSISVNGNNDEYFRHNPDLLRRGRAIDVLDVENNAGNAFQRQPSASPCQYKPLSAEYPFPQIYSSNQDIHPEYNAKICSTSCRDRNEESAAFRP